MDSRNDYDKNPSYSGYGKTKIFYAAGDVVELRHDLPNKPIMLVQSVDKATLPGKGSGQLGVTCIWFNTSMGLEKARFSTKDIVKC